MGKLSAEERPVIGQLANEIRKDIEDTIANKSAEIKKAAQEKRLAEETLDVTMPGTLPQIGYKHPLSIVLDEIKDIFMGMGFDIAEGPEVEYDYYNFEALNIPKDHPARDTQDTFYINDNIVLRTQTSPVQIRVMEKHSPHSNHCPGPCIPLRRGRCHPLSPVPPDRGLGGRQGHYHGRPERHAGDLCQAAVRRGYKNSPASPPLPFTEPSCEIDVSCFKCGGKGCPFCKGEGWVEILGGGMVHPKVLKNGGVDPDVYSGFAFGVGLERLVLFRFNIDDMRLLYENDMRFLSQF